MKSLGMISSGLGNLSKDLPSSMWMKMIQSLEETYTQYFRAEETPSFKILLSIFIPQPWRPQFIGRGTLEFIPVRPWFSRLEYESNDLWSSSWYVLCE